jgi:hypothetical protein
LQGNEWHLFYFDYNDALIPKTMNHYAGGPHIHYLSHLWGVDKDKAWKMLDNRQATINSTHIKYSPNA